ncbi:MAG: molybdate ABC transporter substrate-binding protein [Halanaerobiales bacterium]
MKRNVLSLYLKTTVVFLLFSLLSFLYTISVSAEEGTIRIMAAASLTEVFNDLKVGFEEKYEGIELEINYAGSQALFSQIQMGASADIFASANIKYMKQLKEADMVNEATIFAYNELVIAVSKESSIVIESIGDVIKDNLKLLIADESVPVGRYTVQMLGKQSGNPVLPVDFQDKFLENVISKEFDVKSVVAKIELGEADAGIVYKTDINASNKDKVEITDIEEKYNVIATYPIAILKDISPANENIANLFLDYLYSEEGGMILEKHGFVKESRG